MILVKRSRKNQVALPKAILERAGLGPEDVYFHIGYQNGAITLRPVDIEEKVPPEVITQLEAQALKREPGDKVFDSAEDLIRYLHRKRRR